ncbi:MAG: undecaprenyldiphospho-muramoylpentapeptide beta-N-acetylglucosaminyltransferase [Cytophagales bacterium]|nr:MAG: undecaprenyldiphospho-muramoylpentapeptide beta-N-acetylglucosaminyltransferase [Cytophagales bacterium]
MKKTKIIISGGGTGGHIYPAIAIANALLELSEHVEIKFVGAIGRMEMQKVPAAGYEITGLPVVGIQRSLSFSNFLFPFKLIKSIFLARKIIKDFQADVVIGVGGYASWPLLFAANTFGITTIIQEQNGYAGLANKNLAKKAKYICVAYPNMEQFFPKEKIVFTGNPVRKDILQLENKKQTAIDFFNLDYSKKTIVVIGGSLGAKTINKTIGNNLNAFIEAGVQIIWQTGKAYYSDAIEQAKDFHKSVKVFEFIYEMDMLYAAADIVISRAGALSISELCLAKKPAILVPSPNVAEDHQTKNAMILVENNAAQLVKDELAHKVLVPASLKLLRDEAKQEIFKENIVQLAKPNAAIDIAQLVLSTVQNQQIR